MALSSTYIQPVLHPTVGTSVTGVLQHQCCFGKGDTFCGESLIIDLFRHMIDNFFICCQFGIDFKVYATCVS